MHGGFWPWLFAIFPSADWRTSKQALQFSDDVKSNPSVRRDYFAWAQGYMSGILLSRPPGIDAGLDLNPATFNLINQLQFLETYCAQRTSANFADAVEELRRALRLDPLAVAAHRVLGYALVATGRFGEAVEQWDQWERLAPRSDVELKQLDDVRRAKAAAQTLAGTGTHA